MYLPKPGSLLIAFVLIHQVAFAQTPLTGKHSITWSPFRIIDFVNPGIEMGYQQLHGKNYASSVSIGYMINFYNTDAFSNYRGLRIALEEKKFVTFGPEFSRNYISAEAVFLTNRYSTVGLFARDTSFNAPTYNDSFRINKQTYSLNLKFGFLLDTRFKNFYVDFSFGAGLKYKSVKRSGLVDPAAPDALPRHPNAYYESNKKGNYFTGNIPANIRLIYCF